MTTTTKNKSMVVYIQPECDESFDFLKSMPKNELVTFAKNCNEAEVYTLDDFEKAFNGELISTLGFIFFV